MQGTGPQGYESVGETGHVLGEAAENERGALNGVISAAGNVADMMVLVLVGLFAWELIGRNVFSAPTGFVDQLAAYTLPAIALLAFARSLRSGGHVTIDLFTQRASPKAQLLLNRVSLALETLVCLALTILSLYTVVEAYRDDVREFVGQWLVHEYLPMAVIPFGFLLAAIHCARDFLRSIR